jgi:hypothetical protein
VARKPFSAKETIGAVRLEVDELTQETALAALRNVIIGTPVGNPTLWQNPDSAPAGYVGGHARRNWRVSTTGFNSTLVGSPGDGPGESGARNEAIQAGVPEIARFSVRQGRLYIFNNVPYIGVLNNGHSTQAPANFVEKAIQVATARDSSRREIP